MRVGSVVELVKPLAAGGMGTVWVGHHRTLDTNVAVKLISGDRDERIVSRFKREAKLAARNSTALSANLDG